LAGLASDTRIGSTKPAPSPPFGSVGDSYDDARAESLIGLYELESVHRDGPWRGVEDLELATLSWMHWFNHQRLHSKIGYVPPIGS
jgi:putative transposase